MEEVCVSIRDCSFNKRGNVFLALVLVAPGWTKDKQSCRTEVHTTPTSTPSTPTNPTPPPPPTTTTTTTMPLQQPSISSASNSPSSQIQPIGRSFKFDTNEWKLKMRLINPTGPESELSNTTPPQLVITANDAVAQRKERGHIETFGIAIVDLEHAIELLSTSSQPFSQVVDFVKFKKPSNSTSSLNQPPEQQFLTPLSPTNEMVSQDLIFQQQLQQQITTTTSPDSACNESDLVGRMVLEIKRDTNTFFHLHVHAAINLPLTGTNLPSPFALAKTGADHINRQMAKSTTRSVSNVRNAVWRDPLTVKSLVKDELIFVAVVDYSSKKYICKFSFLGDKLIPGKQYHMGLILNDDGAYVLVTLYRVPSIDFETEKFLSNKDLFRLEFMLHHFTQGNAPSTTTTTTPSTTTKTTKTSSDELALMCVTQYIDDVIKYTTTAMATLNGDPKGRRIPFTTIYLTQGSDIVAPTPSNSVVSFISEAATNPIWECLATLDLTTTMLKNPRAAIIFEFFRFDFIRNPEEYHECRRVRFHGFATLTMSQMGESPKFGETRSLSLPVTCFDSRTDSSLSLDLTVHDGQSYISDIANQTETISRPPTGTTLPSSTEKQQEQEQEQQQQEETNESTTTPTINHQNAIDPIVVSPSPPSYPINAFGTPPLPPTNSIATSATATTTTTTTATVSGGLQQAITPPISPPFIAAQRYSHSVQPTSIKDKKIEQQLQQQFLLQQQQQQQQQQSRLAAGIKHVENDPLLDMDNPNNSNVSVSSSLSLRRPPGLSVQIPPPQVSNTRAAAVVVENTAVESPISPGDLTPVTPEVDDNATTPSSAETTSPANAMRKSSRQSDEMALLIAKQRVLDKIQRDREKMAQKLENLEREVVNLRALNDQLMSENISGRELLAAHEKKTTSSDEEELKNWSKEMLISRVAKLTNLFKEQSLSLLQMQTRYRHSQRKLAKKKEIKREFLILQQAHKEQGMYLQALQEENSRIPTFEETAKKQEKVIKRLALMIRDYMRKGTSEEQFPSIETLLCDIEQSQVIKVTMPAQQLPQVIGSPQTMRGVAPSVVHMSPQQHGTQPNIQISSLSIPTQQQHSPSINPTQPKSARQQSQNQQQGPQQIRRSSDFMSPQMRGQIPSSSPQHGSLQQQQQMDNPPSTQL